MSARWCAAGLVAMSATIAHANPQKDAEALAAKGKFPQAAARFREAYAADPRPELICNVGVAYFKAKDLPRAHRYLRSCLELGKDLDRGFMDSVAKVLASVDAQLTAGAFTPVEIIVQPATARVAVEGDVPFDEPLANGDRVWFPSGDYELVITAGGYVPQQQPLRAKTKSAEVRRYVLEPMAKPVAPAPAVTPAPPTAITAHVEPARPSIAVPIAATGATLGAGIVAVVFHLKSRDYAEQAGKTSDQAEYDRLVGLVDSTETRTWIFGGLAGVGAVASGYLWYRWRRASAVSVDVRPASGGASVTFAGAW